MIVVHHLIVGRSLFTVWLLEELGLEYELEIYHRDEGRRAPPELKRVHPLGKSPVIVDDGMVIAESGAIASYLLERYDPENRLGPARAPNAEWVRFTQWLHYPEGSAFAPLLIVMLRQVEQQLGSRESRVLDSFAAGEVELHLRYIESSLGDARERGPYLLGDFSAVDIGIGYIVSVADRLQQLDPYPGLQSYLQRIQARPAFQRALERTGG